MKTFIPLLTVIALIIAGFSGNKSSSNSQTEKSFESVSGLYYIHGYQVSLRFCYMSNLCEPGEVLSRDTVRTSFIVNVKVFDEQEGLLQFSGLEGADIRVRQASYSGSTSSPRCVKHQRPQDCAVAGLNGDQLEFDLLSAFGRYYGGGTLKDGKMTLETKFHYRGMGIDYFLEGIKIEEE